MRMPKAEGQARKFISSNQWDLLECRVLPRRWVCLSVASAAEALDLFEHLYRRSYFKGCRPRRARHCLEVDGAAAAGQHAVACEQPMVTRHASTVSVGNWLRRVSCAGCSGPVAPAAAEGAAGQDLAHCRTAGLDGGGARSSR